MTRATEFISNQKQSHAHLFGLVVFEPENSFRAVTSGSEGITEDGEVSGGGDDDDGKEGAVNHLGHHCHHCYG